MKHYQIVLSSKNKKSLKIFAHCISYGPFKWGTIKKSFSKINRTKILTVLKSPHINKAAQEQFESRRYSTQINLFDIRHFKYMVFLKKVKKIFSDVKIKIKSIINKRLLIIQQKSVFQSINLHLNLFFFNKKKVSQSDLIKNKRRRHLIRVKNLIKTFDVYGESYPRFSFKFKFG